MAIPNGRDASPEEAAALVKKISDAVDVPLIVWGTANVQKDEDVLKKISVMASERSELSAYTKEEIFSALLERERIGSTGFENGVALPHCSLEMAKGFVSGVLVVPGGVDFDAIDGGKSLVFAFIIGPASERNSHIQLLSAYSRIFSNTPAFARISTAADSVSLKSIFSEYAQQIDNSHYLEKRKPNWS